MHTFDLITEEELDQLPDDRIERFLAIERTSRQRMVEITREMNEDEARLVESVQHSYLNIVLAAAREYGVEGLKSLALPRRDGMTWMQFQNLSSDIEFYVNQLRLRNREHRKASSVGLTQESRDRILTLCTHIRDTIQGSDLSSDKKERLLRKLNEFESSLVGGSRVSLTSVAAIAVALFAVLADFGPASDTVRKLCNNVLELIGIAHLDEETPKLQPPEKPRALSPPRRSEETSDGDDEIPF